jgi:glycosyltransferase involved in cell wall biosynthesis
MKIAIDARWIFSEISGIGNYTRQLLRQFAEIAPDDMQFVALFCNNELLQRTAEETGIDKAANFSLECQPWGVFSPKSQLLLPGWLKRNKIDVFHSPNYMIPLAPFARNHPSRIKCVTTIHDLIPLIFPDHAPKSRKSRLFPIFKALMLEVGRRSDAIITVSNASRHDILRLLKIPERRADAVHTVYNGVSARFQPPDNFSQKSESDEFSLLYVGRSDPYKNLQTLIRAVHQIRTANAIPVRLVLAGSPDPRYPEVTELIKELNLESGISWTGYLKDSELIELYRNSDLLVHPSRYEGFGLQIIEAMACGTPVVCSNAGSLPEVAGDAAIMAAPDDVDGFADAITNVLTNKTLAASMRKKGFEQAAKFTWLNSARETLDIYRQISQTSGRKS